jgi:cytochrome c-type biogenesis protein CcmH/NrfG
VDDRYTPAMYALAVLLVFERQQAAEATLLLEDYLSIERSDIPARFLLARAYLEIGRASEALDLYDEISRLAGNPADVEKAQDLYRRVAGGEYGA